MSAFSLRRIMVCIASFCTLAAVAIGSRGAGAVSVNAIGVAVSSGSTATITMSNTSPSTVATVTTTDAPIQGTWQMSEGTGFWGGTGSAATAYTPTIVHDSDGVGLLWNSSQPVCSNVTGTLIPGTSYECVTHPTVKFDFSREVTNPVISIADLAGGGTTATLFSDYELVEPGYTLTLLSHVSNFEVHSDGVSFGTINPPGTGFNKSGESAVNLLPSVAFANRYGAGYGSIQINGTMTSVSFRITLRYRTFSSTEVTSPIDYNDPTPEGVSILMAVPGIVAHPDTQKIDKATPYSGSAAVTDNSGESVYSIPAQPSCGAVSMEESGSYTFTANSTMNTECTFTYQMCSVADPTDCVTSEITLMADSTGLASTGSSLLKETWVGALCIVMGLLVLVRSRSYRYGRVRS